MNPLGNWSIQWKDYETNSLNTMLVHAESDQEARDQFKPYEDLGQIWKVYETVIDLETNKN